MAETIGQVRSRNKKIITKRNEKETDLIIIPSEYCSACFQYSWPSSLSFFFSRISLVSSAWFFSYSSNDLFLPILEQNLIGWMKTDSQRGTRKLRVFGSILDLRLVVLSTDLYISDGPATINRKRANGDCALIQISWGGFSLCTIR